MGYNYGIKMDESRLGERVSSLRYVSMDNSNTPHILAYTGILDYMGDEIVLTILVDDNVVTDEGYTEYALEVNNNNKKLGDVSLLIKSHNVKQVDGYVQSLEKEYSDDYEFAVKSLTSCIVDIYASLIY